MREWRSCWRLHGALRQRGRSLTSRSLPALMAAPAQQRALPCPRAMWHPIFAAQVLQALLKAANKLAFGSPSGCTSMWCCTGKLVG